MDSEIVYPGAAPQAAQTLQIQRNTAIALGFLAQATFGSSTCVDGLAATPAGAGVGVVIGPGSIYQMGVVDQLGLGISLAPDLVHDLLKTGINLDPTTFALTVPAVPGQAINYLVECMFAESDGTPLVNSFYNAANPAQPLQGPGGGGAAQNTKRTQVASLQLRAGAPAPLGEQATPGVDAGWVGLWIVTARYGVASIVQSDIVPYPGAPFIGTKLPQVAAAGSLAAYATIAAMDADIAAEAAARAAADNTEALARNNEDINLQNQINAEAAARNAIRPGYPSLVAFEAPGVTDFVVPAGVTVLKVTAIGGGGGGGGSPASTGQGTFSGGGGGAGAGAIAFTAVTPGQVIPITVGAGGAGGVAGTLAASGSSTSVGSFLSASGGSGGDNSIDGAGGIGGTPYGSVLGFLGGDGSDGGLQNLSGGNGGSGIFGGGGRAGTASGGGGTAPGSGGGSSYSGTGGPGGSGANGLVIIEY